MSSNPIDHAALARSRVVAQYRNSPKFMAWVGKVCEAFDDIEAALLVIAQLDDIEAQNPDGSYVVTGVNLDVVGARIGQPRRIPGAVPRQLFGWDDDASALAFGEETDERVGGVWYNEGETLNNDAVLDDVTYRIALRARKYLNTLTVVDAIDVYTFLQFVMPEYTACPMVPFQVFDLGGMAYQVEVRLIPTLLEEVLLAQAELMPRPVGVDRPIITYWDPTVATFGFDDDPNATAAFGEETDPTAGGVFAEEIHL
jgi:hypothetical protein